MIKEKTALRCKINNLNNPCLGTVSDLLGRDAIFCSSYNNKAEVLFTFRNKESLNLKTHLL